jgi:hypothetical protein
VEFLKRLHEEKPHSDAATREYLNEALMYESDLPTDEALAVADLALQAMASAKFLLFDPHFYVAELYLHHHARLSEASLLRNATNSERLSDARRSSVSHSQWHVCLRRNSADTRSRNGFV